MKIGIPPLVIGNWKMNPQSVALATRLATDLKKSLARINDVSIVVAPPFVHLDVVRRVQKGKAFLLGAQNVHTEKLGSRTGEISLTMLKDFCVRYVILGHSERRAEGETDERVNQKLVATIKGQCTGVVCVGEKKRDHAANYLGDVEMQIRKALVDIPKAKLGQVVVAYEPVWAIGTGNTATPQDVHEMRLFIEKIISDLYGRSAAQKVRIIYGGSVNAKNAHELFALGTVDGFLVGGASLHADEFTHIVKAVRTV